MHAVCMPSSAMVPCNDVEEPGRESGAAETQKPRRAAFVDIKPESMLWAKYRKDTLEMAKTCLRYKPSFSGIIESGIFWNATRR